jgi:hypothetical protein
LSRTNSPGNLQKPAEAKASTFLLDTVLFCPL